MPGWRTWMRAIFTGRRGGVRRRILRRWWSWMTEEPGKTDRAKAPAPEAPEVLEGHRLHGAAGLSDGEAGEWMIDGRPVAVARIGDRFMAVEGECPHAGGPLGEGSVVDGHIVCPLHGWSFDLETGTCDMDEDLRVGCFQVTVSGEDLVITR